MLGSCLAMAAGPISRRNAFKRVMIEFAVLHKEAPSVDLRHT